MLVVGVAFAVLAGAIAQRISGMGFALVVAPVLVLLLGPFEGVLMVNLCGAVSALIVITRVWRDIDWRQYLLLAVPAVCAIVPGVIVSVSVSGPVLQVVIGSILIVALTASLLITRTRRVVPQLRAGLACGTASGFMSATAGIGGPGVAVYSVLTNWEHRQFAATVQPLFATLGIASFGSKVIAAGGRLPEYDWWLWLLVVACTLIGLALGEYFSRLVSVSVARVAVIVISYAGGALAIVDGTSALL